MSDLRNNENFEEGSQKSTLCVDCHEFFGNTYTDNLCSKCFSRTKAKDSVANLPNPTAIINQVPTLSVQEKSILENKNEKTVVEEIKTDKVEVHAKPEEHGQFKQKDHTRCTQCNKKVGLLGFKCPCESTFCRSHRLPEAHDCSFDFAKAGKEKLAKENIVVVADKVQRF